MAGERDGDALRDDSASESTTSPSWRGAPQVASVHPPREGRAEAPVSTEALGRLAALPEFRPAHASDGLASTEMVGCGLVQRTLTQFVAWGWALLERMSP